MNRKTIFATLAVLALGAGTAHAHRAHDAGVNHRQAHQHARIAGGVASGALTRGEAGLLAREQAAIRAEERFYKSDGRLTRAERADLHRDLNRSSRHIWFEKHDGQRRF